MNDPKAPLSAPRMGTVQDASFAPGAHPTDNAHVEPMFDQEAIRARVAEMGAALRHDLGPEEITLLCILKGSFIFTADLARAIPGPVNVEFLGVASYGDGTTTSGAVQITHDLTAPIEGKHVVIVEDIVDTGLTLQYLKRVLAARRPQSLKVCALLVKPSGGSPVSPDYAGFTVGDDFVVGYGLDWAQRLRNLDYIGVIRT